MEKVVEKFGNNEHCDLNLKKIKSGTNVLDWTVPDEWNITDGYIISPSGKKIANFKKHSLHVVNYSIPVNKKVSLEELKKHLHTLPEQPNAIPYVTSYYKRTWGFSLAYNEYKTQKGLYKVYINQKLNQEPSLSDTQYLEKIKKYYIFISMSSSNGKP